MMFRWVMMMMLAAVLSAAGAMPANPAPFQVTPRLVMLAAALSAAGAMRANPAPFTVTQPSTGMNITLRLMGGEHFNWLVVGKGIDAYTVLRNDGGDFVFAEELDDGSLGPTSMMVGEVDPEERRIPKNLMMTDEARDRACQERGMYCSYKEFDEGFEQDGRRSLQTVSAEGDVRNLVVLMRWSDHRSREVPSVQDIEILMNNNGPHVLAPTGSVRDVFTVNSYGKLNLTSTVYKWVTMDNTETYYADGTSGGTVRIQRAIKYALEQLENDSTFDFGEFDQNNDGYIDAITFLHSGYGAENGGFDSSGVYYEDRIWSHKWNLALAGEFESARSGVKVNDYHISPALWGRAGSRIGRIGVIAHETAHFLGLPDLYDAQFFGAGIGTFSLMANSWGFSGDQYYPPQLDAWSRIRLGWDEAEVIDKDFGTFEIAASEVMKDVDYPRIYRIDRGYPDGEYLLLENRQPLLYDSFIPQGGLAIWHIDMKQLRGQGRQGFPGQPGWPENNRHYRIALLQADTKYQLEKGLTEGDRGDLFHGKGSDEIKASLDINYGPFPNTDAYQGGEVYRTGHRIYEISVSDEKMSFRYQKLEGDEQANETSGSKGLPALNCLLLLLFVTARVLGCVFL